MSLLPSSGNSAEDAMSNAFCCLYLAGTAAAVVVGVALGGLAYWILA